MVILRKKMKNVMWLALLTSLIVIQMNVLEAESAVCDVTSEQINEGDGYLATTTEVLGSKLYWKYVAETSDTAKMFGVAVDDKFLMTQAESMNSDTPWLLSEKAARIIQIADEKHRAWVQQWWRNRTFLPPGNGRIDLQKAYEAIRNRNK